MKTSQKSTYTHCWVCTIVQHKQLLNFTCYYTLETKRLCNFPLSKVVPYTYTCLFHFQYCCTEMLCLLLKLSNSCPFFHIRPYYTRYQEYMGVVQEREFQSTLQRRILETRKIALMSEQVHVYICTS